MPKLQQFIINFDNASGVFFGGQNITGNLAVTLNEPMKMRAVKLQFKGKAHNHWTERRSHGTGDNRRTETIHYDSEEKYCDVEVILWGNSSENEGLPVGTHLYPFSFQLPLNCPTSFEGQYGNIRYFVKGTIDKPWKFDHTVKRPFTVIGVQDLNLDPMARQPVEFQKQKQLGIGCCKAGNISVTMRIPRRGYVGGEIIPIFAEITNDSSREIKRVEAKLVQNVTFQARRRGFGVGYGGTKHSSKTLAAVMKNQDTPAGQHISWENEGIRIPPVPPMLLHCNIIHINYTVKMEVKPSGPSFGLDLQLPVTIGTIPLREEFQSLQTGFQNRVHNLNPSAPPLPTQDYPDCPPPSYQQSVDGPVNIKEEDDNDYTHGDLNYAPQYTYYDWSQSTFAQPTAPTQF